MRKKSERTIRKEEIVLIAQIIAPLINLGNLYRNQVMKFETIGIVVEITNILKIFEARIQKLRDLNKVKKK